MALARWTGSEYVNLRTGDPIIPSSPSIWPNASNSGYLGNPASLTALSGYTVSAPNTTIENRRISDAIRPEANNITIRNCIIDAGYYGVLANTAVTGLVIEDCTIIGGSNCGILVAGPVGATVRRCNVYGGADGMKISGTGVIVRDNYIHDLHHEEGDHNDGIQVESANGVQFIHNYISALDTSAIGMFENAGPYVNVLVQNNWLAGGNYPLYAGGPQSSGMTVEGNVFSGWNLAPVTSWNTGNGNTWSSNTRADDGTTITP